MLINKLTKQIQTRSDKPNENWLGDEWCLVPDNSELAKKILVLYPEFELIIENNEIVDVREIPKTEDELKKERANEIKLELEELDSTINRATEDLYALSNLTPYASISEVINRKNELRKELGGLNE